MKIYQNVLKETSLELFFRFTLKITWIWNFKIQEELICGEDVHVTWNQISQVLADQKYLVQIGFAWP